MTPERAALLAELLLEVCEKDGGFIPNSAFRPFHRLCSWAAVETLMVSPDGQKVLLRYRNDPPWDGWHIVGGYVKPKETVQAFADRAAKEEKANIIGLVNFKVIAICKWLDHPYSFPFCALMVCNPLGEIVERDDLRWFDVNDLPLSRMLHRKHVLYLEHYRDWFLNNPERWCPVIGEETKTMEKVE